MNLTLTVIEIVAPVFLLAAIGFIWVKLGFEYQNEFVTRLTVNVAMPCLIFVAFMQTKIDPAGLAKISVAAMAAYGTVAVVATVLIKISGLKRKTYLAPCLVGNTGNLGMPLALFAFGEAGLDYAVVIFAVSTIWVFTFGIYLVSGHYSLVKMLREPLMIAPLLGVLFLWQGWETPRFLTNTLSLIGQMAIPLLLLTLGVAVARLPSGGLGRACIVAVVKLLLGFAIGWGIASVFDLGPIAFGVLVLQMSTPFAVISYLMAEKYDAEPESVAALVLVSTVLSVAAIPAILTLLL